MDDGKLFGRGIAFPPRIGPDGRWMWSQGPQNVREAIEVILLTELNERVMRPGFGGGLHPFLFQPNTVATHRLIQERATQALARWEPRIRIEGVTVTHDPEDLQAAHLQVQYRLVATGLTEQVSLAVRFAA